MNSEQKNTTSLSASEVEKISYKTSRVLDYYREYKKEGISSHLDRYEDGVIYLKIVNNESTFPSNYDTALKFAMEWKSINQETLGYAKGFVVLFSQVVMTDYKPLVDTGWPISEKVHCSGMRLYANVLDDKLSNWESKYLQSIFSGMF